MHRLFTALTSLAASAAVTACSADGRASRTDTEEQGTAVADSKAMGHVHGLGVNPTDGVLYVASHFGVFRIVDGSPDRVADRWQDTMGFAVVGPDHFLGSGHPDLREDLPPSLGLIESTDGAETWHAVSLLGEADLHAIEAVGDRIYAYDSQSSSLIVTTDRERWDTITRAPLLDLAADPAQPDMVYATTASGDLVASRDGARPVPVEGAPTLNAIDWQADGPLVGVTPAGTVMSSPNGRTGWEEAGSLDGPVTALDASSGQWHAATESGLHRSTDRGVNWDRLRGNGD